MKKIFSLLLLLSFMHVSILAQYRPPGMSDMSFYKEFGGLLKKAIPAMAHANYRSDAEKQIEQQMNSITGDLRWLHEGGYLVRVRVQTDPVTLNSRPLAPEFLGMGRIPSDIVVKATSSGTVSGAPAPELPSGEGTFFIWLTRDKNGKVHKGLIDKDLAKTVSREAVNSMAQQDILEGRLLAERADFFNNVRQSLSREVTDRTVRERTENYFSDVEQRKARLAELEKELKASLAKAEKAGQLLNTIRTLQTVLSVASLAAQIEAALDDIPKEPIRNARTPQDQVRVVEEYRTEQNGRVETTRREITISAEVYRERAAEFDRHLELMGFSPELRRRLRE